MSQFEGRVKWFDPEKAFGFISTNGREDDVFVHVRALESAGIPSLDKGDLVQFDIAIIHGRERATNIRLIERGNMSVKAMWWMTQ